MRFKLLKVFVNKKTNNNKKIDQDTNDVPKAEWILCTTARTAALDS